MKKILKITSILSILLFVPSFCNAAYELNNNDKLLVKEVSDKLEKKLKKDKNSPYKLAPIFLKKLENLEHSSVYGSRKRTILSAIGDLIESKFERNVALEIIKIDNTFTGKEIKDLMSENKKELEKIDNVFLFRYNLDLSLSQVKTLTNEILSINPKTRIFIDQEGGYINRFKEFEGDFTLGKILKINEGAYTYYNKLSAKAKWSIHNKVSWRKYFMSMNEIGQLYDSFSGEDKDNFLKFITYYRLQSLKNAGINTAGIVLDLDYGNPVISGYDRSFSDNKQDYIKLGKDFVDAAKSLNMSLYFKHFPGHGKGIVDTHKGVLRYSVSDIPYIQSNMGLFNEVIEYANEKNVEVGLMIGHFVLPNKIKDSFINSIKKVDYIITDDVSMKGYLEIVKNPVDDSEFFSTTEALLTKKGIILNTGNPKIQ